MNEHDDEEELVGYFHFRRVDTDRFPVFRCKKTGNTWYTYSNQQKYAIRIPVNKNEAIPPNNPKKSGWDAFTQRIFPMDNHDVIEVPQEKTSLFSVYLSDAFLLEEYVDEINQTIRAFGSYPSKLHIQSTATHHPIDGKTTMIELPPDYIPSIMATWEQSQFFSL
jgi:hypothetical protein